MASAAPLLELDEPITAAATPDDGERLAGRSFIALTLTQALGAMNDNLFRWLIIPIGKALFPESEALILGLGAFIFFLPFLVCVAPAGYFSDRFSKRSVIIGTKIAETVVMACGVAAILCGSVVGMFLVLFFMGAQSAIFGPAKYGCIPEMIRKDQISKANGFILLTTMLAIIVGTAGGGYLFNWTTPEAGSELAARFGPGQYRLWISALALVGVAIMGTIASLFIRPLPSANTDLKFPTNWFAQTERDLGALIARRTLLIVALGSVFYWALGALTQMNIDAYATKFLHVEQKYVGWLLGICLVGMGIGAVIAGWISKKRIELGLTPIAAFFLALFAMAIGLVGQPALAEGQTVLSDPFTPSFIAAAVLLWLVGLAAGCYDIPLLTYLQERSPRECRGQILAAYNFLSFAGMMLAAGLYFLLASEGTGLGLSPRWIWVVAGGITLAVCLALAYFALLPLVTLLLRVIIAVLYRPRILGLENIPKEGGVLLVGNHTGWADGALMYTACPRPIRYFAHATYISKQPMRRLSQMARAIPVVPGKRSVIKAMRQAQRGLLDGDVVCIFPEGGLTRTGGLRSFQSGFLTILRGAIRGATGGVYGLRGNGNGSSNGDTNGASLCRAEDYDQNDSGETSESLASLGGRVQLIPFYIGGMWGSLFSYSGGKAFWKWPKFLSQPVTIAFGRPIACPATAEELRQIITELGVDVMRDPRREPELRSRWIGGHGPVGKLGDAHVDGPTVEQPKERPQTQQPTVFSRGERMIPARAFLRMCRRNMWRLKLADTTGVELKGADVLLRTLLFRRLLRREVLAPDERFVGLLLPPSVGGVLANAALTIDGRVPINLNYTFSSDIMNYCIRQVGIRHVLTSRKVMEKFDLKLDADVVYVDDLRKRVTLADKVVGALATYCVPIAVLERMIGLTRQRPDDLSTVVFTSGSTGKPKGAMLTHHNVGTNVQGFVDVLHIGRKDAVVGILPFFHAFGFTTGIWAALVNDAVASYHYTPLEPRPIGNLVEKYKGTIVPTTPTFLRNWLKRGNAADWKSVDALICGAEKLPKDLADECEKRLGVRPWEGYGATELSPVVSTNVPPERAIPYQQSGKEGSVGQAIPGVAAKVVDLETGEDRGPGQKGMLLIKGPNVMKGYHEDPERTAQAMRGDWYVTGDIAMIDDEGFIFITGRESRMSKIGGEMVPHVLIEEAIARVITAGRKDEDEDGLPVVAVAGLPDAKKGERVVVLHVKTDKTPEDICKALRDEELPALWIPDPRCFREVDSIPVLGTGKLDLQGVKRKAEEFFPPGD